jgi:hypothetical protein
MRVVFFLKIAWYVPPIPGNCFKAFNLLRNHIWVIILLRRMNDEEKSKTRFIFAGHRVAADILQSPSMAGF